MKAFEIFSVVCMFTIGLIVGAIFKQLHLRYQGKALDRHSSTLVSSIQPGERIIADVLHQHVRVMCMIFTMPPNHATKAVHVKATWAPHCNHYLFVSSVNNTALPSVAAVSTENRENLWSKTKFMMRYAAEHFGRDFDYFLKADDDTYVIVENLRKLLLARDPEVPFIMGRRFRPYVKQGYLSGGGGYVLSRAGLHRVAEGLRKDPRCLDSVHGGAEDVNIGTCADAVNVTLLDSLDDYGLERFHPFNIAYMMSKSAMDATTWIKNYNYHKLAFGMNCCSDYSTTFHYVPPSDMHAMHYMLYHLRPYGIHRDHNDLASLLSSVSVYNNKPTGPHVLPTSIGNQKQPMPAQRKEIFQLLIGGDPVPIDTETLLSKLGTHKAPLSH